MSGLLPLFTTRVRTHGLVELQRSSKKLPVLFPGFGKNLMVRMKYSNGPIDPKSRRQTWHTWSHSCRPENWAVDVLKMIKYWKAPVARCFDNLTSQGLSCSTSPPGGNQVDGLPPASSFETSTFHNLCEHFCMSHNFQFFSILLFWYIRMAHNQLILSVVRLEESSRRKPGWRFTAGFKCEPTSESI